MGKVIPLGSRPGKPKVAEGWDRHYIVYLWRQGFGTAAICELLEDSAIDEAIVYNTLAAYFDADPKRRVGWPGLPTSN